MKNLFTILLTTLLFISCSKEDIGTDDTTSVIEPINVAITTEHYEGHDFKACAGEQAEQTDFERDETFFIGVQNDEIIIGNMNTKVSLTRLQHEMRLVKVIEGERVLITRHVFEANDYTQGFIWKIDISINEFIAGDYELIIYANESVTIKDVVLKNGYVRSIDGVEGNRPNESIRWLNIDTIEQIKETFNIYVQWYNNNCN